MPDKPSTKSPVSSFESFLSLVVFVILGFILYGHVLNGEFISDDYVTIVENAAVRNAADIPGIFQAFNTRFLTGLTFAFNYMWGGLDPFGYHVVNVLLHLVNTALVYAFALLLCQAPQVKGTVADRKDTFSIFAALIFLCHPIQTQGVSFITQRAVELVTLFYLVVVLFYLKYLFTKKRRWYMCSVAFGLVGILTKENILTLPLMIPVLDGMLFGHLAKRWRGVLFRAVPYLAVAAVLVWVYSLDRSDSVLELKGQMANRGFRWEFFLTELNVLTTYLRLLVFPANQNHDYDYPLVTHAGDPRTFLSLAVLLGLMLCGLLASKRERLLTVAVFWFFVTTSVEVAVVSIVNRGLIYEHWMYLPMAGCAVGLSAVLHRIFPSTTGIKQFMAAAVVVMSILTYQRNMVWQTETGFWEDVLKKSPQKSTVYLGAGKAYQRAGDLERAQQLYERALKLYHLDTKRPQDTDRVYVSALFNNLGIVYYQNHRDKDAEESFLKGLTYYAQNAELLNNLGVYYFKQGAYARAVTFFEKAVKRRGPYAGGYHYLGLSHEALGHRRLAQEYLEKARALSAR